jgi:hypothetical protein
MVFVQNMPVDPMNRNAQFELVAYWSAAFTGVSARRDQSNLRLCRPSARTADVPFATLACWL